jgi:DNA repair exonuclease SbcCD nuclease subunit
MRGRSGQGFDVGLAHGSLQVMGLKTVCDFPVNPTEIVESKLHYLALGHWHKIRIEQIGQTTIAYPGIPQPISWSDPGDGSVLVVRIEDTGKADVFPYPVSEITFSEIRATIYHPSEVEQLLKSISNPKTIVKMALKYSDNLKEIPEVEKLLKNLSKRFLSVQAEDKRANKEPVPLNNPDRINQQFIEAFRAELAHLKEADSPDRSKLYEKAAELGEAIITGDE